MKDKPQGSMKLTLPKQQCKFSDYIDPQNVCYRTWVNSETCKWNQLWKYTSKIPLDGEKNRKGSTTQCT